MQPPFHYKGTEPLKISAETLFAIVKSVISSGREEDFLRRCRDEDVTVMAAPRVVNLVKDYFFDNGVHKESLTAREIVNSDRCPPPR
jgi:hypothetical protein